ncbi:MAG TPA: hypothetical protein VHX61_20330 [Rhizomicrobium sp.]|nr:hypothetical protein [Rhizomicrobium sp.]
MPFAARLVGLMVTCCRRAGAGCTKCGGRILGSIALPSSNGELRAAPSSSAVAEVIGADPADRKVGRCSLAAAL